MSRALIQQMLDALSVATTPLAKDRQEVLDAITAAQAYLAAPEQLEPKEGVIVKEAVFGLYDNDYLCYHVASAGPANVEFTFDKKSRELVSAKAIGYYATSPQPKAPEQLEPIGYVYSQDGRKEGCIQDSSIPNGTPLYTHPAPQPTTPEPVAIFRADEDGGFVELIAYQGQPIEDGAKLYTAAPQPTELNYEELLGAIARGWCTPINERKVMDSDLAIAIAEEVVKYLAAQRSK